jgi:hypothetical protein
MVPMQSTDAIDNSVSAPEMKRVVPNRKNGLLVGNARGRGSGRDHG